MDPAWAAPMLAQSAAASLPVARPLLVLLAVWRVSVGMVWSEFVKDTASFVVRLVRGLFSFPWYLLYGWYTLPDAAPYQLFRLPTKRLPLTLWYILLAETELLDTILTAFDKAESASTFFIKVSLNSSLKRSALAFKKSPFPYFFRERCIDSRAISLLFSEMRLLAFPRRTKVHWTISKISGTWMATSELFASPCSMSSDQRLVSGLAIYSIAPWILGSCESLVLSSFFPCEIRNKTIKFRRLYIWFMVPT